MSETTKSTYAKTHQLEGDLLGFSLQDEAQELRKQAASAAAGHTAKTLIKEGPLSVTMVALSAGSSLDKHQVAGPITIQCLNGRLNLTTDEGAIELAEGSLVALDAGVPHSAKAIDDCTLLLTLTQHATAG